MADDYYEVIAPDRWKNARPYKEYAYKEQVHIKQGKGICKSASTAALLRNLGYTTVFHGAEESTVVIEEEDTDSARAGIEGL